MIAATNKPLAQAVSEGRFRQDLFYRLDVFPVEVPPLRERREDIPLLSWTFVKEFSNSMGKAIDAIADDSMPSLMAYPWPGNIRELRNVIERAMILARGPTLHIKLGHPTLRPQAAATAGTLEEAEREHILQALERSGWRIRGSNAAAELLGVKPTTLNPHQEARARPEAIDTRLACLRSAKVGAAHRNFPCAAADAAEHSFDLTNGALVGSRSVGWLS